MDSKKVVLLVVLVVAIIFAIVGTIIGVVFYRNNDSETNKRSTEKYYITLEDMYCNVKDSKKILKVKITVETVSEDTKEDF